jgi:hypothetical protein
VSIGAIESSKQFQRGVRYTAHMTTRIKQFSQIQFIMAAVILICTPCVSAQSVNGVIVKSDKVLNQPGMPQRKDQHSKGLSISSPGDISTTKMVNVNGSVNMNAGKSITVGSPTSPAGIKASSSVNLNAPTIHNPGTISAGGNVNISTTNLINAGSITAKSGDVNISNHSGNSLLIDNSHGSITGKTVTLRVNDSHKSATGEEQAGSITVKGGTISGDNINVGGKDTRVDIDSDEIDGKLNVPNTSGKIRSNHTKKSD